MELATRAIADLHERATGVLPLLDAFYAGQAASPHLAAMRESLRSAIDADLAGDPAGVSAAMAGYGTAAAMLARFGEAQVAVLRAAVVSGC